MPELSSERAGDMPFAVEHFQIIDPLSDSSYFRQLTLHKPAAS
jgi:hypothetical protein